MAKPCPVDLLALRNIVGLCAFAAETQRVLADIDTLRNVLPEFDDTLKQHITACCQWTELPFPLSEVLGDVWSKIDALDVWQSETQGAA